MSNSGRAVERGALGVFKFFTWIIYALAVVAMIVLGFAFVLLMFGAKPTGFAETIYTLGSDFMNPFKGMITPTPTGGGGVLAWSILIAIAAYAVLAWVLGMILGAISRAIYKTKRTPTPQTIASVPVQPPTTQPPSAVTPTTPPAARPAAPPAEPPQVDFAPAPEPAAAPAPEAPPAPAPSPQPPAAPPSSEA